MEYKKNPHAGFSPAFFQRGCDSCVGEAQMGKAHLRRHANLRFARISRSRAPERKENAIREDSRRFAVKLNQVSTPNKLLPESHPSVFFPSTRTFSSKTCSSFDRPFGAARLG